MDSVFLFRYHIGYYEKNIIKTLHLHYSQIIANFVSRCCFVRVQQLYDAVDFWMAIYCPPKYNLAGPGDNFFDQNFTDIRQIPEGRSLH